MATEDRRLVGVPDIVRETGLDEATVRFHLDAGQWPGVRVGRRGTWRVPRTVLDYLLVGRDPSELKQATATA